MNYQSCLSVVVLVGLFFSNLGIGIAFMFGFFVALRFLVISLLYDGYIILNDEQINIILVNRKVYGSNRPKNIVSRSKMGE